MYQSFFLFHIYMKLNTQHVSGDTPPIIRSLKLHWQPLAFHTWKIVGHEVWWTLSGTYKCGIIKKIWYIIPSCWIFHCELSDSHLSFRRVCVCVCVCVCVHVCILHGRIPFQVHVSSFVWNSNRLPQQGTPDLLMHSRLIDLAKTQLQAGGNPNPVGVTRTKTIRRARNVICF